MQYQKRKPVACVVGAASGLGKAVAEALSSQEWEVLEKDVAFDDSRQMNAAEESEWEKLNLSSVDALVVAAGIREQSSLSAMTLESWRKVLDTNLTSAFLALRAIARTQENEASPRPKSVVLFGSAVIRKTVCGQASYNASKAGVVSLVRSAALELADLNVRVNAVSPGSILTPMTQKGWEDPSHSQRMKDEIPLGRAGCPSEVAQLVLSLVSPKTKYVTGSDFVIDGGWSL